MKTGEIRTRSNADLRADAAEKEQEIFQLRFRRGSEKAADPSRIRALRKQLARIRTVLRERELDLRGQAAHGPAGAPRGGKAAK